MTTGKVTTWNPNPNNIVWALALRGNELYVGGQYTNIGGAARSRIASIDINTGLATGWNPTANNIVYAIAYDSTNVYAGGTFTRVKNQNRTRIVALDFINGNPTAWAPNADNVVRAIAATNNNVYIGGLFSSVGGQSRRFLAALDPISGSALGWDPNPDSAVYSLHVNNSNLFVGGKFANIGGQSRNCIAEVNLGTGVANSWNPGANNFVFSITSKDTVVFAGGQFSICGGKAINRLAGINLQDASSYSWNPNPNLSVRSTLASGSRLYVGGDFASIDNQARRGFAVFALQKINTDNLSSNIFCNGSVIDVDYTTFGSFNPNNVFTAQISDMNGSFIAPNSIGSLQSNISGTISCTIPMNLPLGTGYRIRVVSSDPPLIGTEYDFDLKIDTSVTWYLDNDNDGYYVNTQNSCLFPGAGWTSNEPLGGSGDCDDNAPTAYALFNFYRDIDGDGYGAGSAIIVCAYSSIAAPTGFSTNNTDCDSSDASKWQGGEFYIDIDG
jgi:hypothetical protein